MILLVDRKRIAVGSKSVAEIHFSQDERGVRQRIGQSKREHKRLEDRGGDRSGRARRIRRPRVERTWEA